MKRLITLIYTFIMTTAPTVTQACSICFYGDADTPANRGLRWGVLTLLAALLVIMLVFVRFLVRFRQRARAATGDA